MIRSSGADRTADVKMPCTHGAVGRRVRRPADQMPSCRGSLRTVHPQIETTRCANRHCFIPSACLRIKVVLLRKLLPVTACQAV